MWWLLLLAAGAVTSIPGSSAEDFTVSTPAWNLSFDSVGVVTGVVDRATGRNVVAPNSHLLTASFPPRLCPPQGYMGACPPCICHPVPATNVTMRGDTLQASFPTRGAAVLTATIAISVGFPDANGSISFNVVSLSPHKVAPGDSSSWADIVKLSFFNISLGLPQCGTSVAAGFDGSFSVLLSPSDGETHISGAGSALDDSAASCTLTASSFPASGRCQSEDGAHCGSATVWAGPRARLLPAIQAVERGFSLPSPTAANGVWLKASPQATDSYVLLSGVNRMNWAAMLELAALGDFRMVVLLDALTGGSSGGGHYGVSEALWGGVSGLANAISVAHNRSIRVGLHTMSGSIPPTDSYVTPLPDRRLGTAAPTYWTLVGGDLPADMNSSRFLRLDRSVPPAWGFGSLLRIGDELLTFGASGTDGSLSEVVRGAYGTIVSTHRNGSRVDRIREMFGVLPDPSTDLIEEIGGNLARTVNAVDADYVYFDGLEALISLDVGDVDFDMYRLHRAFWQSASRQDIEVQSSADGCHLWHLNTRAGQIDWGGASVSGERHSPVVVLTQLASSHQSRRLSVRVVVITNRLAGVVPSVSHRRARVFCHVQSQPAADDRVESPDPRHWVVGVQCLRTRVVSRHVARRG